MNNAAVRIEKQGRRYYLVGNTYPFKDALRSAGAHWDRDRGAWWTSKSDVAERFASAAAAKAAARAAVADETKSSPSDRPAPGRDQVVAGKVEYKGRTYYLAGRVNRGRTHYDDRVDAITTRDGSRYLVCFRDGSRSFWADRAECKVLKSYSRPQTIGQLLDFAAKARDAGGVDAYLTKRAHESGRCRDCGTQLETWHDGFHAGLCHDCF